MVISTRFCSSPATRIILTSRAATTALQRSERTVKSEREPAGSRANAIDSRTNARPNSPAVDETTSWIDANDFPLAPDKGDVFKRYNRKQHKGQAMNATTSPLSRISILLCALSVPLELAAQEQVNQAVHHHYKLIDMGTFGGSASYFVAPENSRPILNDRGMVVGGSSLATAHHSYE